MNSTELRGEAKRRIETLPKDKLKVAAEFLAYLEERASQEAMEELLKIPGLLEDLEEAGREIAEGKTTPVEALSRKHKRDV